MSVIPVVFCAYKRDESEADRREYAVKCEKCGHEDAIVFREKIDSFKELAFELVGRKCLECGGEMTVDSCKVIQF
jgi:uncharacterized OB-fold protein